MSEQYLQRLSKQIRIDADKEQYYKYYDETRDFIVDKLRKDRLFKFLFFGTELSGSCADDVKINKPDEFDCYIYLEFNKLSGIRIFEGNQPSTAYVNMYQCCKEAGYRYFKDKILKFTSNRWNILPSRINSWIQGLIARVISEQPTLTLCGRRCSISFSQHGPAQSIFVRGARNLSFSIDFVPSIKVSCDEDNCGLLKTGILSFSMVGIATGTWFQSRPTMIKRHSKPPILKWKVALFMTRTN